MTKAEASHTPGPWLIDPVTGDIKDRSDRVIVNGANIHGYNVPSMAYPPGNKHWIAEDDGGEANAHVLAAAPTMLNALKDAEREIEDMLEDFCQSEGPEADTAAQATLVTIRAAIANAEGRS